MQIRRKIVGGNWKSNLTFSQVSNLIKDVLNVADFDKKKVEVIVAPVFPHIDYVMRTAYNV